MNPNKVRQGVFAISVFALGLACLSPVSEAQAPKKLEDPLAVYVFTIAPEGMEKYAKKAEKTVSDQIKKRKDWFRLTEDKATADILVEVYQQGIGASESKNSIGAPKGGGAGITTEGTPAAGGGAGHNNAMGLDAASQVKRGHHFFETEVSFVPLGTKVIMIGTASANRRPQSAASDLAKKIEQFAKDNYEDIASRR